MHAEKFLTCLLLASAVAPTYAAQQRLVLQGDLQVSADTMTVSFRSDSLDLQGNVHIEQGPDSITSERATAADTRSNTSHWTFERSVHIQTAEADLKADKATAIFDNGTIASAKIEGSPANFVQRGVTDETQVRGRAGIINYDFRQGLVTLTNDPWFAHGRDQEISGGTVVYNLRDETVRVNSAGQAAGRVKGIIRPRPKSGNTTGTNTPDTPAQTQVASESGS
jgi:lipopolysaccharide transport protein LptA